MQKTEDRSPKTECVPQRFEVWEHLDGGSMYVRDVTRTRVKVQRRPFGDSLAEPRWMMLYTFERQTTGRLLYTAAGRAV